ncbi:thioesterase family protein [Sphingomonas oligophenolica]|uniref:Thioesterase family protein n=1 Tax=Sphingomonas oligophenolica TaxID=301154 RepID=A0A502CK16_9SPHN|nr:thioesterase family protein [Sphingomonas oligophenolica]TPG12449.1 thioesterase family protein [Sphingomonas oligophenolica]
MTSLKAALDALEPIDGGWRGSIPDGWLQGRTAYGGLSTALALHAAQHSDADLPPLRSAQVAFIGPLSGDVTIRATRLRRGRNAAWVQADVASEAGLGLRATFVFMGAVASAVDHQVGAAPDFPPPAPDTKIYNGFPGVSFTRNFDLLDRRDELGPTEWLRWVRLSDRDGLDRMVELVAIADCLPPAALKLVGGPAPVSSMTWQLNLLGPAPVTTDGWWLLRAATDYAKDGSSSQTMAIWNTDGTPIAEQIQSVAIFA